ncbi:MAG: 50S ribosomal protein L16 [Candidatus Thermoplasmatota archaeon]|nr:50S ribosomal protein L16 [Candidatus Thermoplasmatota archaeon]
MGRMPGRMYRRITQQAYTRREYIGGVPGLRIQQFELGNKSGEFPAVIHLVAEERCQIRHQALESARIATNRVLVRNCGGLGYHLKVRVYPHHVLRHNKQAAGAGADRISSGMRQSFGKPVGAAARVESGQAVFTVRTNWGFLDDVKEAFRRAKMKLPTPCRVEVEGEIPKNIRELEQEATAIGTTVVAEVDDAVEEEPEEGVLPGEEGEEGEVAEGEAPEGEEGDAAPADEDADAS